MQVTISSMGVYIHERGGFGGFGLCKVVVVVGVAESIGGLQRFFIGLKQA